MKRRRTLIRLWSWMLVEIWRKFPESCLQLLVTHCWRRPSLGSTTWNRSMEPSFWIETLKYSIWFWTIWDMILTIFLRMSMKKWKGYLIWKFSSGVLSKNSILKWNCLKIWLSYSNQNQHLIWKVTSNNAH